MRSGLIVQKVGMTRLFTDSGQHVPVTVLKLDKCQVVAQRTEERDGYTAVQLGSGFAKVNRTSKAMRGHFANARVELKRRLAEFRVSPDNMIDVGAELAANHFLEGQHVDATGVSIGRGFAGAMKRHIPVACVLRMVCLFRTVRTALPVNAKIRAKCLRERKWPVIWAMSA